MKYGNIKAVDIADGPGVRVSLFVSGCRNHCPGCFQPETWSFDYGEDFTAETLAKLLELLHPDYIRGLTILGGDPMEPENWEELQGVCEFVKAQYPEKDIWLYTGYHWEDLKDRPGLDMIDVMVDGPFVEAKKDLSLRFRGSSNQRLINVERSLRAGEAVLWHDEAYEHQMKASPNGGGVEHEMYRL